MAHKRVKKPSIVAKTIDGSPVVEIFSLKTEGDKLIMDCKALDSMRMDVVITADDIAAGWPVVSENKSAIFSFGKKIPKAVRRWKKEKKKTPVEEKSTD